jgi:hypothetical protein
MYERDEFEPSICTQLDTVGMQPHSREFLERQMNCARSGGEFYCRNGHGDFPYGIQFSGEP